MLTVAYLANEFPCPVEPYVGEEIDELQRRRVQVIAGSVRRVESEPEVVLERVGIVLLLRAAWLCWREWTRIADLIWRIVGRGREGLRTRTKALLHTWLGACYALRLRDRGVDHIHVHHGYFGSWIAMVAARLLRVQFSMTLHGSDLLLHGTYLDVKLANCKFCLTVSEYNRSYILAHCPEADPERVLVARLGTQVPEHTHIPSSRCGEVLSLLAVGRLHAVKDHAFLVRACAQLRDRGVQFECSIAGEGPERRRLESLIRKFDLERQVVLLGHVQRRQMNSLCDRADVMVLTSRSEGIPLVLMEAMARGKIVLAPAITGIPELVIDGKTGFLYQAGSLDDFVTKLLFIHSLMQVETPPLTSSLPSSARQLDWIRHAAQVQVRLNFNRKKNLESFVNLFIQKIALGTESIHHEDIVLQQIQLPVQRDRGVPVRTDGVDAVAGPRSSAVLHG